MRKKIREIMNKEEGFTLVELLAVLAILAIIVAIAIPAIGSIMRNSETKAEAAEQELVIDAARLYDIENEIGADGVTVEDLVKANFLELKVDSSVKGTDIVRRTTDEEEAKHGMYIFESKE